VRARPEARGKSGTGRYRDKLALMADKAESTVPVTGLEVDPSRLAEMISADEVEVIDVRRDHEYEAGHIPGSRHIEINELTASAASIPKDRPVVFYCRSGNRAGMPAEAFERAGYDAHNLAGGVVAWVDLENPLEPANGVVAEPRPL